jgi:hypothetical protein
MAEIPYFGQDSGGNLDPFADGRALGDRSAWDTIVLGGEVVDAIATVKAKGALKVDDKSGAGKNGGSPAYHGRALAAVEITLTYATKAQHDKIVALLGRLWPPEAAKKKPNPVDVYHPALVPLGIKSVTIIEVGTPEPIARGAMRIPIRAQEFKRPSKGSATVKPIASVKNNIEPERLKQAGNSTPVLPSKNPAAVGPR